jgi:hydroxypyruvate isomerase
VAGEVTAAHFPGRGNEAREVVTYIRHWAKAVAKLELRKMAARKPARTLELSTKRRVIHERNSRTSKTVF